jgi:hypothetical protein
MEKKYVSTEKEKHTITITNKYDPNVDYYREREIIYGENKKSNRSSNRTKCNCK